MSESAGGLRFSSRRKSRTSTARSSTVRDVNVPHPEQGFGAPAPGWPTRTNSCPAFHGVNCVTPWGPTRNGSSVTVQSALYDADHPYSGLANVVYVGWGVPKSPPAASVGDGDGELDEVGDGEGDTVGPTKGPPTSAMPRTATRTRPAARPIRVGAARNGRSRRPMARPA